MGSKPSPLNMTNLRSAIFRLIGGLSAHLPAVRGKNRVFLSLFGLLGLKTEHVLVDAHLRYPTPYKARLDLHSWLQRLAFVAGEYEADTVRFLLELKKSTGRTGYLLDVGANIGLIAIPTALLLEKCDAKSPQVPRVVCVEAVPDNEQALRLNVAMNGVERLVSVIGTGLGDRPGSVDIQVEGDLKSGEGTGTANILPAGTTLDPNGTYECVRIPIQITTLDALMQTGTLPPSCTLIKIDTDGYDLKILRGGRGFMEANRPVIFGEFSAHCMAWHDETVQDVIAFAAEEEYLVWQRLPGTKMRFTAQVKTEIYTQDLLLVPSELAKALSWCCASLP